MSKSKDLNEKINFVQKNALDTGINSLALAMFSVGAVKVQAGEIPIALACMFSGMMLEFFKYGLRRWKAYCLSQ